MTSSQQERRRRALGHRAERVERRREADEVGRGGDELGIRARQRQAAYGRERANVDLEVLGLVRPFDFELVKVDEACEEVLQVGPLVEHEPAGRVLDLGAEVARRVGLLTAPALLDELDLERPRRARDPGPDQAAPDDVVLGREVGRLVGNDRLLDVDVGVLVHLIEGGLEKDARGESPVEIVAPLELDGRRDDLDQELNRKTSTRL